MFRRLIESTMEPYVGRTASREGFGLKGRMALKRSKWVGIFEFSEGKHTEKPTSEQTFLNFHFLFIVVHSI